MGAKTRAKVRDGVIVIGFVEHEVGMSMSIGMHIGVGTTVSIGTSWSWVARSRLLKVRSV